MIFHLKLLQSIGTREQDFQENEIYIYTLMIHKSNLRFISAKDNDITGPGRP